MAEDYAAFENKSRIVHFAYLELKALSIHDVFSFSEAKITDELEGFGHGFTD